jgi:acetoacetyl-CoA synthetase
MKTEETPPTIAALAALSGQGPQLQVPSLVLLKAGTKSPSIFIAHGMGDTVMGLVQLASHLQVLHPIYGMQARGLDGLDDPLDRIEDMADFHLDTIRQVQAHGPYVLIGYSLGGLVTLEMARRLSGDGEKIALLAMLDSYPERHHLPLGQHARLVLRLAKMRAASFMQASGHQRRSEAGENRSAHASDQPQLDESTARARERVKEYQDVALRKYRPQFYDGKINFVKAAIPSFFPDDPAAVWAPLAKQFEIETVPGDHLGILTTQVENLARVLSRYLGEASLE